MTELSLAGSGRTISEFLHESEPASDFESQFADTYVDETEWLEDDGLSVSSAAPASAASHSSASHAPASVPHSQQIRPFRRRPVPGDFHTKRVRSGRMDFLDAEGSPCIADTYESDGKVDNDLVDDASFSIPQSTREKEHNGEEGSKFVYEFNGVTIDLSEVHPCVHKLLLRQNRSDEYGKLPPTTLMHMWKVWFPI